MRKLALLLLLLSASAFASVTVTANLRNVSTSAQSASIRFQLQNCGSNVPRVIGTGVIVKTQYEFSANASTGIATGSIYGNDEIDCGGAENSVYAVSYLVNGIPATGIPTKTYVINASSGTWDASMASPTSSIPSVEPPVGDNAYLRLDGGNASSATAPLALTNRVQQWSSEQRFKLMNGVPFADQYPSFAAAIAALPANSGFLYYPPNVGSGVGNVTSTIDLSAADGVGSNRWYQGAGPFTSALVAANGLNAPIWKTGSGLKSRYTMWGLHFDGNKTNQTGNSDCVQIGEGTSLVDLIDINRIGSVNCAGNGLYFGQAQGYTNLRYSTMTHNTYSGVKIEQDAVGNNNSGIVFNSFGNLVNYNGLYGYHVKGVSPGGQRFLSFGDYLEQSAVFNLRADNVQGVGILAAYSSAYTPIYFNQQTRQSYIAKSRLSGPVHDAGFYNKFEDNICDNEIYAPQYTGICANRNKFPVIEEHLDPSIVNDWDMSKSGTSAWTAGTNATISKTTWVSSVTGQAYLKLTCSVAPCEVTQDVTDTIGGNGWFRVLYTTSSSVSGPQIQIRRSDTNAPMVDSGALTTAIGSLVRPDFAWESPVQLTGGSWRIALRCNSTTVPCFFTDVRLVKNYAANPSYENSSSGAPLSWTVGGSYTNCSVSNEQQHTGSYSVKAVGDCRISQSISGLVAGEYYLVKGWIFKVGSTGSPMFGWGDIYGGTKADSFYVGAKSWDESKTSGEWQLIEMVVRADAFGTAQAAYGMPYSSGTAYYDDVSVIHLRQNKQVPSAYFDQVSVNNVSLNGGISPTSGSGYKATSVNVSSLAANTAADVSVTWGGSFPDALYFPDCMTLDSTGSMQVVSAKAITASGMTVTVKNIDTVAAHTAVLFCKAIHQ